MWLGELVLSGSSTATSTPLQEMFVLEHPETTVQQTKGKEKKEERKKKKKKRVSREEDRSVGKEGTESKGLVHKEGWEGIDKKRRVREVRKGKRKGKREKKRERERERVRVSTHIYPPPSDVHPRTSKVSVWGMFGFRGRGGGTTLSGW